MSSVLSSAAALHASDSQAVHSSDAKGALNRAREELAEARAGRQRAEDEARSVAERDGSTLDDVARARAALELAEGRERRVTRELAAAEQARIEAEKAESAQQEAEVHALRLALHGEIPGAIARICEAFALLAEGVSTLQSIADQDRDLASELGEEPLSLELLRLACCLRLGELWQAPEIPEGAHNRLQGFTHALAELDAPGGTTELGSRLRCLSAEWAALVPEPGDFARIIPAPGRDEHSAFATRCRKAMALLDELSLEVTCDD